MSAVQFNRPPRLQPELPIGERTVPNPPTRSIASGSLGMVALVLPLISILAYALLASRGGNPLFILPMGITAIASGAVGFLTWRNNQRAEEQKQESYRTALAALQREMEEHQNQQMNFLVHNYPPVDTVLSMAQTTSERLFERRPGDPDFGAIRVGAGRVTSSMELKPPSSDQLDAPQSQAAHKLVSDFRYLQDAPITISLRTTNAVGVTASNTKLANDFARAVAAHLAAFHAPHELRLFVVGGADAKAQWNWARRLPHCASQNPAVESQQLCFDEGQYAKFWDQLQYELERRELLLEAESARQSGLPLICVLVDATLANPLDEANARAPLSMLMRNGRQINAAVVFLTKSEKAIPEDCQAVVRLQSKGDTAFFSYEEIGINSPRRNGKADWLDREIAEKSFAKHLTDLVVRTTVGAEMPNSVTLLDLLNITGISSLPISEMWHQSLKPGPFLPQVTIGRMAGGRDCTITFDQNAGEGAHGLIAGTSGSGKSELLLTLVASLAIRYPPELVNFVLVDYKGGTAFEPLRKLPHTVDVITNMSGHLGTRVFTAMNAEMRRRESVLVENKVKEISDYYDAGIHLEQPLPHLFILIDEFAELIREREDLRGVLDSIARKGRALGMHLILATQRPGGLVSDQIQANIKLRICLRVEAAEDSRELLGRADATFLPRNTPGRAFMRVGKDLDLVQIAQVGFTYQGTIEESSPPIVWHDRSKQARESIATAPGGRISLLDIIVEQTRAHVEEGSSFHRQPKPWHDPLPEQLSLTTLNAHIRGWLTGESDNWSAMDYERDWLSPAVGLIDDPANAARLPLVIDLAKGNVLVVGAVASGKTTLIQSIVLALAAAHSPAQLTIYGFDTSRSLTFLNDLPHVGAIVSPDETERVQRTFRRLTTLINQRRRLFEEHQVNDITQYNQHNPDAPEPAVLVLIDSLEEFIESNASLRETFSRFARDGQSAGIRFLVAADQAKTAGQYSSLFSERLALSLTDLTDYVSIIGRRVASSPEVEGRGYLRVGVNALEFQTAIVTPRSNEPDSDLFSAKAFVTAAGELIDGLNKAWEGPRPPKIQVLRTIVPLDELAHPESAGKDTLTVGIADTTLEPFALDLNAKGPHLQILGSSFSGKTTLLRSLALTAACNPPGELALVFIDTQGRFSSYGGQSRMSDLPHVLRNVESNEDFDQMMGILRERLEKLRSGTSRRSRVLILIDNYEDFVYFVSQSSRTALMELVKLHGREYCSVIAAGLPNASSDNLMSLIKTTRYGIALSTDALSTLSSRLSASASTELPMGRGYVVSRERLQDMVQFATPLKKDLPLAESLDQWIDKIVSHYSQ